MTTRRELVEDYYGSNTLSMGLFNFVAGPLVGCGVFRAVFECQLNSDHVIKIEISDAKRFCNVQEWDVWQCIRDNKSLARWFAPCRGISPCGNYLIQDRTQPVTLIELQRRLPKVPRFFTDLKPANWGKLGKRIVCHDYANNSLTRDGEACVMKRAKWWE